MLLEALSSLCFIVKIVKFCFNPTSVVHTCRKRLRFVCLVFFAGDCVWAGVCVVQSHVQSSWLSVTYV